jgi:hypothetical protein
MVKFLAAALFVFGVGAAEASVRIAIDKSAQLMSVSVDGVRRYTWPVSTGRAGYATPSGTFRPFRTEVEHYSKEWDDAPMPHSIFFTRGGHAIHGSYETRRLGRPVSHGCVRLAPKNASILFSLVQRHGLANTTITVSGGQPRPRPPVQPRDQENAPVVTPQPYEVRHDRWQQPPSLDSYYGRGW